MTRIPMKFKLGLTSQRAEPIAKKLKVLADPTRLRIISLLLLNDGCMAVEDLVDCIQDFEQSTISRHLVMLHSAGLLTRSRRKNYVYYQVRQEALRKELMRVLSLIPATADQASA